MENLDIASIERAINRAKMEQSNLTPEVLASEGMSSPKIRHLYNNLGALATGYVEIGTWKGASFISTLYGNDLKQSGSIDNFSEFNPDGTVQQIFHDNLKNFLSKDWEGFLWDNDCWAFEKLPFKPDLYLFDGGHSFEDHKKAVTHFFPMMADRFIFVVDDYSHPDFHAVKEGTLAGLEEVQDKYKVVKDWELWEEGEGSVRFWNGIGIFLIERI
jgi:hypothetical protein